MFFILIPNLVCYKSSQKYIRILLNYQLTCAWTSINQNRTAFPVNIATWTLDTPDQVTHLKWNCPRPI